MVSLNLVSTSLRPVKPVCTAGKVKVTPRHLKNTRHFTVFWFLLGFIYFFFNFIFQKNKEQSWAKPFAKPSRKCNKSHECSLFPCKLQFAIPTTESCGFGFLTVMLEVKLYLFFCGHQCHGSNCNTTYPLFWHLRDNQTRKRRRWTVMKEERRCLHSVMWVISCDGGKKAQKVCDTLIGALRKYCRSFLEVCQSETVFNK